MMSVYFFTGIFFTLGFNAFLSQVADDFVSVWHTGKCKAG